MLSGDDLADIEGDVLCIYDRAAEDPEDPPAIGRLVEKLLGARPSTAPLLVDQACLVMLQGEWRIFVRRGTPTIRARWLVGHELAEWWYRKVRGYTGEDVEERCDALGAALVAPRPAVRAELRRLGGHRVHLLAERFGTTQSVALLRIGEVTGRPVALVRKPAPIVRGEPFEWPSDLRELRAAVERPPAGVHPLRITDEANRWGLMARAA